ncbi:response regulator [Cryobacterium frigoriphilum]|uniref:Response regulator n=1 Tax=Cryobacterium frigoriphilum TaxID=1259150 RepID=A0A4R9A7Z4_9MICO|nr:response regulator [Cryobacterium frigoriphilum]TFD53955.1 response regulator [Cryobacterium frigoriphilum]
MTRPVTGIRALIVEDDASVSRLHVRYLEGVGGFTVLGTAVTGAEAVAFVTQNEVDLVLLDMHLPDFSGIEVLHRLRALTFDNVDVIVVSSATEAVTVRQAAAASVEDYLVKPFSRAIFDLRLAAYRARFAARALSDTGQIPLRQVDIDRLIAGRVPGPGAGSGAGFGSGPGSGPATRPIGQTSELAAMPKGLSAPTVELILRALRAQEVSTAVQVATGCGLARGTARRYLDFLRQAGLVDVTHRYGARGRPELLYSVTPAARHG